MTDKAQERRFELWDQLAQTPAKSVTGIALKLVALFQWDDGLQDAWSGKSEPELGQIMCLAARADALRLAGMPHTYGADEPEGEYVDTGWRIAFPFSKLHGTAHVPRGRSLPQ
jgi:hypothetical protein